MNIKILILRTVWAVMFRQIGLKPNSKHTTINRIIEKVDKLKTIQQIGHAPVILRLDESSPDQQRFIMFSIDT